MRKRHLILTFFLLFFARYTFAQNDTAVIVTPGADSIAVVVADSVAKSVSAADTARKRSPARTAALLSAILPGAGQAYNKKYWKMPIVYGALAIPAYTFVDNLNWFKKTRFAYNVAFAKDTARYKEVDPRLLYFVENGFTSSLQNARNEFRRNVDYSVLVFMLLWGLNVVDAAVDAHLKDFNISDDLSIRIKPGYQPLANTAGIGIVLNIGKNPHHGIPSR